MSTEAVNIADPQIKRRYNVSLSEETKDHGEELAAIEKRSFSNLLEVLIDREWERVKGASQNEPQEQTTERAA